MGIFDTSLPDEFKWSTNPETGEQYPSSNRGLWRYVMDVSCPPTKSEYAGGVMFAFALLPAFGIVLIALSTTIDSPNYLLILLKFSLLVVGIVVILFSILLLSSIFIRRCRAVGRSVYLGILLAIPLINVIALIALGIMQADSVNSNEVNEVSAKRALFIVSGVVLLSYLIFVYGGQIAQMN